MSDELLKAARTCMRNGGWCDYDPIYWNEDAKMAACVIVSADLIEHPVDDDEPITAEWLDRVSHNQDDTETAVTYRIGDLITFYVWKNPNEYMTEIESELRCGHSPLADTRGDVRRLCTALGVPLEEQ